MSTQLEDFFFDLRGFLILKNALSPDEVLAVNQAIDAIPPLVPDGWFGNVHRQAGDHEINILVALTDIGKGDGATTVIPGTHKSQICHPSLSRPFAERIKEPGDDVEGAIEVHLEAVPLPCIPGER